MLLHLFLRLFPDSSSMLSALLSGGSVSDLVAIQDNHPCFPVQPTPLAFIHRNLRNGPKSYYLAGPSLDSWAPKEHSAPSFATSQLTQRLQTDLNSPLYANPASPQQAGCSRDQLHLQVSDSRVSSGKPDWPPHWGSSHHHPQGAVPQANWTDASQGASPDRQHQHLLGDGEKCKFSSNRIRVSGAQAGEGPVLTRSSDDQSAQGEVEEFYIMTGLLKGHTWISRDSGPSAHSDSSGFWAGPESLAFLTAPRRCCSCWSADHTGSSKVPNDKTKRKENSLILALRTTGQK